MRTKLKTRLAAEEAAAAIEPQAAMPAEAPAPRGRAAAGKTFAEVPRIQRPKLTFCIRGTAPMIFNRLAEKAKRELLLPSPGRKNAAEKAATLKHDPEAEFRASTYRHETNASPTRLYFPPTAFKCVLGTSALDMPGTKKSQIGRLVWIDNWRVDIFGVPELYMAVVRDSGINHAPDIRTRAILPEWACTITMIYAYPLVTPVTLMNLLDAGGSTCGIGDYRQEKGKASFGQFDLVNPDDEEFHRICREQGREAQDEAIANPRCYDSDSEELLTWYQQEILRRRTPVSVKPARRRKGGNGADEAPAPVFVRPEAEGEAADA